MLRTYIRLPLLIVITLIAHAINLASRWFLRPFSPRLYVKGRGLAFRFWCRNFARFCGMRVKLVGQPPRGRFFLVSNHVSYVDIILLGHFIDAAFIAKSELRGWPVLGRVFATADTIFIDRSRKKDILRVMEDVDTRLDLGLGILLFPEGTSGKGDQLLRFKPSVLQVPAARRDPVYFATLHYRTPEGHLDASESVCWWGDEDFLPHAKRLTRLPYFEATVHFNDEPFVEGDRKVLAERLRAAMDEQFVPMD